MAIPTHEQIIASLRGQQVSMAPVVLPKKKVQTKSTISDKLKSAAEFGRKIFQNSDVVTNPMVGIPRALGASRVAQDTVEKVLPGVGAIRESVKQKSIKPFINYEKGVLDKQFGPKMQNETPQQYIDRVSVNVIGFVGGEASLVKDGLKKTLPELRGAAQDTYTILKNLTSKELSRGGQIDIEAINAIEEYTKKLTEGTLTKADITAAQDLHNTLKNGQTQAKRVLPTTLDGQLMDAVGAQPIQRKTGMLNTQGGFARNPLARAAADDIPDHNKIIESLEKNKLSQETPIKPGEVPPKSPQGVQNLSDVSDISLNKNISNKVDSAIPKVERQVTAPTAELRTGMTTEGKVLSSKPGLQAQVPTLPQVSRTVDSLASTESTNKLLQKSIVAGDKTKTINPDVGGVAKSLKEMKTSVLEFLQNSDERIRQLVSKPGVVADDVADPYLKSSLYSGRVGARMESAKNEVKDIILNLKNSKVTREELSDYLQARHAPERNAALGEGAAGITTKEAGERLAQFELSPKAASIKIIADKVQEINRRTLQILKEGGVITDDLFNTLKTKYKSHVPLQRIMDETDDFVGALSGKGFDVKSSGIFAAKGSKRKVSDILGNVIHNYEQAIMRAEKNVVDQSTLAFVRKNKDILGDSFEIIKPKAIGKTFDGKPIMEKTNDPSVLQMFKNGKKIWVKIKDKKLALALRGVNKNKVPPVLNFVANFTRLYSGLMTRFNPEFALPNKIRDLQEVAVYLSAQKGVGIKGAAGAVGRDAKSVPDVIAYLRGKDTPGARLYKEMKEMGGTTGGMGLSTRKEVEMSIDKLEKLANSKTKQLGDNLIGYIDNLNMIFEDSTRLSVYKQALSQGLSKERAAFLAKEASINFNRMGTGGPVINALYMFSNASIQGTVKMLRSLKNPKVLGTVSTAVAGSVAAVNEWNDSIDPEWREKVSKWDRLNSLPVMLPNTNGDGAHYFTIPVSWGIKPIKVMADYAYDAVSGQEFNARTMLNDLSAAILNAYNPIGGTDFISAITPTIFDVPVDLERNVSWTGTPIRPDFDPNAPKDIQYYSSLGDTKTGQIAISISEMLQDKLKIAVSPADIKYAFDQYVGGVGRTVQKTANTIAGVASGDVPDIDEFPIVSRFYRSHTEEEVGLNKGSSGTTEKIKNQLQGQSRDRFKVKNDAEKLFEELKKMPVEEANAKAAALKKTDNLLYVKLKETIEEKKLGLSYTERLMKQLGVTNGERARFVYEEILKLPKDKRNAYYADLKTKKVISETVDKQLKQLLKNSVK